MLSEKVYTGNGIIRDLSGKKANTSVYKNMFHWEKIGNILPI
jgi:hypothetical protein